LNGYRKTSGQGGIEVENIFLKEHQSQNVIGYFPGSVQPDSFIVFSAHYDHLGQLGKDVYFPGANDNASGCAMLLNLVKYYSMPEHMPSCSIAFMAFCGEEVGLLGSKYYTEHPLFPLNNIKFMLNMDIMGTGEEGITVVNGILFKKEFDKLKEINIANDLIADVKIRGKAANSDHYFFAEKGVRACFIYTMGGTKAYHDIYDRSETLPLNEFEDLFKLITKFGDYLQGNN
jgi:Zn-dependent M28 family amino/carboxypeptidase